MVDPVYLALKKATGIHARRSSSAFGEDSTPSPRNLSQGSLQDSGFSEASYSTGSMVRSTPLLPQTGNQSISINRTSIFYSLVLIKKYWLQLFFLLLLICISQFFTSTILISSFQECY